MAYLDIQDLSFTYPGKKEKTLHHINLQIEQGEYVLLCGVSGSGKTTLLRHFKSVMTPYGDRSGMIYLDGKNLSQMDAKEQAARVGYVMQNPDEQIVTDKVWHELAFGLENLGYNQKVMRIRVAEMASYFGIQKWFHSEVNELSGGQKQLLNLASIMAMQPGLLILDEPTSQLDPIAAADFLNTIRQINRDLGTTIIITEHRMEDVFSAADRVVVMDQGKVIANDHPGIVGKTLFDKKHALFSGLPAPMQVYYQMGCTGESPMTVRDGRTWLEDVLHGKKRKNGVSLQKEEENSGLWDLDLVGRANWNNKKEVLRIKHAWFRYEKDGPDIIKDLNLHIPEGIIFAIVGGNGTGKSTALKMICGIHKAYRGKIEVLGKDVRKYKSGELFSHGLSMMPQDPLCLFVKKTVREDLLEMVTDECAIEAVVDICEIRHILDSNPHDLSGGEIQRAALAKVMLTNPRLLLLDEPTKGMDCNYKKKFAALLRNLQKKGYYL